MIKKYLDISTAHITEKDSKILEFLATTGTYPIYDTYFGFIVLFPLDVVEETTQQLAAEDLSSAFDNVVRYAANQKCDLINLDCDASIIKELETFEW